MTERRSFDRRDVAALLCIVGMGVTTLDVARRVTLCADEPAHIGAGFSYVQHDEIYLGADRPPLFRLITGHFLHTLGVEEGPRAAAVYSRGRNPPPGWSPPLHYYGKVLLVDENEHFTFAGQPAGLRSLTFAGRLPTVLATLLLGGLCWWWARDRFGPTGGLVTAALVATYQDAIGWGAMAHTDLPVTTACVGAVWAFDRLARRGGLGRLLLFGLAIGVACMTKVTALFLLPALALAAAMATLRPLDPAPAASLVHPFATGAPRDRGIALVLAAAISVTVALVVVWVCWLGRPLDGLRVPRTLVSGDYLANCLGSYRAWTAYYFAVAFALKVPLGTAALLGLAAWAARRGGCLDRTDEVMLLAPALTIFALVTWTAPQLGTRLILPAIPFLLIAAGRLGPWLEGDRRRALLVAVLLAWNIVGVAHDHPYHATRLNGLAGDPRRGHRLLEESSIDLGHGVSALRAWQDERGIDEFVLITSNPLHDAALLSAYGARRGVATLDPTPLFAPEPGRVYVVTRHILSRAVLEALRGRPRVVLGVERAADGMIGDLLWFDLRAG